MGATFAFSLLPLNYYSPSLSHFFSSYNKNSNSINPTHHSMLEPHPPLAMAGPPRPPLAVGHGATTAAIFSSSYFSFLFILLLKLLLFFFIEE
ncbi:proline-rich receptor-like protein kinase PERK2 [Iris pallida]|uniref:Proline-rich receptor-like protein kinase PERK2 n=1 Tax=Iris pallida TaxID=29817 RepID=A0AAX6GNM2_IRIPA|nr:proline-rich receptor-like protein kinase PERK2 [Iris pallida]